MQPYDLDMQRKILSLIRAFLPTSDEPKIRENVFFNVTPIENEIIWNGITITRVPGQHGIGDVLREMGNVSGFIFNAEAEPKIYWTGDTIWCITQQLHAIFCENTLKQIMFYLKNY